MMLWLDDQVFCTYHESSMLQLQGVNSVNHSVTLGVSPCQVMQCRDACFLEVGFDLSKVMSQNLALNPKKPSQEALGEDAILHRSSGRPGEDKKKVEKMLGELPDAIDDLDAWTMLICCGCFHGPSKTTISFKKVMFQVLFTMIMGVKVKDNASTNNSN